MVRYRKERFEIIDNTNPIAQAHTEEPVEFPLFTWEKWDVIEEGVYVYSPVTLKVDIGVHEFSRVMPAFTAGKKFAHATVDYQKSIITFYDTDDAEVGHKYALHLAIGGKIT